MNIHASTPSPNIGCMAKENRPRLIIYGATQDSLSKEWLPTIDGKPHGKPQKYLRGAAMQARKSAEAIKRNYMQHNVRAVVRFSPDGIENYQLLEAGMENWR